MELQEIKCNLQVNDKYNHLEKLHKNTENVWDSIHRLEPQTDVILETLTDRKNVKEINSVYQQAKTIEYQVTRKKNIQFWNQQVKIRRIVIWNMVKNAIEL